VYEDRRGKIVFIYELKQSTPAGKRAVRLDPTPRSERGRDLQSSSSTERARLDRSIDLVVQFLEHCGYQVISGES
jgi:hypothetical protein